MDAKLLTEKGWKDTAAKFKIKDNGLQKALAAYEKLPADQLDERQKEIAVVIQLGTALKKDKTAAASPEVVKYLTSMITGAAVEQTEITKDKVVAEKAKAVLAAKAAEKKTADQKKGGKEDEKEEQEEEEEGDYAARLLIALQKVKGAKDVAFEFIVCDAKPHCGVMVAKKITPKHREELSKVTGGSKRFLPLGACQFVDGRFNFTMDAPPSGLARKVQDSIKNFTGKKFPIKLGAESAEEDDAAPGQPGASAAAGAGASAAAKPETPVLAKAPELWHSTRGTLDDNINHLKQAIRTQYAGESPQLLKGIEDTVSKLDVILEKLDRRLADSLAKAHAAKDAAGRAAELKNSKLILSDYIKYVKTEPLIAHIDANPFGIQTNLKQVLTDSLTHMAQAIG